MLLANDVGAEDLGEQLQLCPADSRRTLRDAVDRAVVLAQADRPVVIACGLGQVAVVGLDDRELSNPIEERRIRANAFHHLFADPAARSPAPRGEDLCQEVAPTDGLDGIQQAGGQRVVVRGKEVLGVECDVVQMTRPADAVTDRPAADQVGRLEGAELLQDACPARAQSVCQLVR